MNPIRLGLARAAYEITIYFRRTDEVFFTFLFPVMMLTVFAVAFSKTTWEGGISAAEYYLPAMLAAGMFISGTQALGIEVATERLDGTLKRLAGTPLTPAAYFTGKLIKVLVTGIAQAALLILVASLAFGVGLPSAPGKWIAFAWLLVLGLITSSWLGIALARIPRNRKSASAVVLPFVLILQFISGVYLPFSALPDSLRSVASVFPLKWFAQGMRSVFLPDSYAAIEQGGAWHLGQIAVVTCAWLVVGAVATRLTFRWIVKE
ncbi:ABC transporter permease [Rarobacter incanus]|uniref:ABC-2 type transport system permease protein n=1 Tax=Rarobacter incanus TaxID=153494 RepID=A0A542SND3_9MICO|nr:ABC transporter permease [Rarobacter incanus]TQK76139.1 ABC-2 type transport system permease protein [Rarobacter incanus]